MPPKPVPANLPVTETVWSVEVPPPRGSTRRCRHSALSESTPHLGRLGAVRGGWQGSPAAQHKWRPTPAVTRKAARPRSLPVTGRLAPPARLLSVTDSPGAPRTSLGLGGVHRLAGPVTTAGHSLTGIHRANIQDAIHPPTHSLTGRTASHRTELDGHQLNPPRRLSQTRSIMTLGPFELPAAADFHVHLRDGAMSSAVVPTIRRGGVNTAYVMPNLVPPVTTVAQALEYKARLEAVDPSVNYLMTLYLHESITPYVVREAKRAGISGIKSYPAGVTTNSSSGVLSYEPFYPVFAAMEECGLVLNLHGEIPSDQKQGITILNAESKFLPTLKSLHTRFPKLRIVLEHCSTKDAVEAVNACGDTVVGTLTCHHLFLTVDDWAGEVFSFCKPVAKTPEDRTALLQALVSSKGKFFLGTDSAPHDISAKKGAGKTAAGVFTQPYACQLVLTALEEAIARGEVREEQVTQELLEGFFSSFGRTFYGVEDKSGERIRLSKGAELVCGNIKGDGVEVVPFRSGQQTWTVNWI